MNVLVLATLYPNRSQPVHAVFVEQRIQAMAKHFPLRVLCPIPWFPVTGWMARYRHRARIPRRETRGGIEVEYPRFISIPRFLKPLDAPFLLLRVWWRLLRLRREFPFDRIDAHLAYPDGWAAVALGKIFRVPVSVTLRGHDLNDLPQFPIRRAQVRWTLRHADAVIAVADALREAALEHGAEPSRAVTVGNGVDPERFPPLDRREARRRLGLSEEGRVLLSVGHLVERKGFHHVVRALPQVLREVPDTRLVIVGAPGEEGDYSGQLARVVEEAGCRERVVMAGAVPNEELAPWYAAADVFCLASAKEGRPNVVLEALACGTPAIATRVWGTPELIPTEKMGRLVDSTSPDDLGSALTWALQRTWNRDEIVQHARGFSWDATADRVARILESLGRGERV